MVNTYAVNVTKGNMREELINTTRIGTSLLAVNAGPDIFVHYKLATSRTLRNGTWTTYDGQRSAATGSMLIARANIDSTAVYVHSASAEASDLWYYPEDCV